MAELKIQIPDELGKEIKENKLDISSTVIDSIKDQIARFVALKTIASKSKLTEKDAIELGRKSKKGRFNELKKLGLI